MRPIRFGAVLACLGLPLVVTATALCCGGPSSVKLPAPVHGGIVHGEHFYAIGDGRLIDVNLQSETVRAFADLPKLIPALDACGDRIAVTTGTKVLVLDAASGKVVRELGCPDHLRSFRFAGRDRLLVRTSKGVDLVDLKSGQPAPLSAEVRAILEDRLRIEGMRCDAQGKRLFVLHAGTEANKPGLAVIDLDSGKVVQAIAVPAPTRAGRDLSELIVLDTRVVIVRRFFGWGISTAGEIAQVDLKTGKYKELPLPDKTYRDCRVIADATGAIYLVGTKGITRYDAAGNLAGKVEPPPIGALVGFWEGQPITLVSSGQRLLIDMPLDVGLAK